MGDVFMWGVLVLDLDTTFLFWLSAALTIISMIMGMLCLYSGRSQFLTLSRQSIPFSEPNLLSQDRDSTAITVEREIQTALSEDGSSSHEEISDDIWEQAMGPVMPKAVRLNQLYCDNGIYYDSDLLSRYNRLGRAGLSIWELSDEYESEIPDMAEHEVAGGSSDPVMTAHQVPVATGDRHGPFSVKTRFLRSELNQEVWVSSNPRGYAFHRKGCGIKVSEKRVITLETALEWGNRPCQQCFNDYLRRLTSD